MDVSIVNPFLKSSINMFEHMFQITPTYGKPFIVAPNGSHRWELSGVIGIIGCCKGVVILRVTRALALKLLAITGIEIENEADRPMIMREMISELVNIISGNALGDLEDKDIDITPSITIQGENHQIAWPSNAPVIGVPFLTPYGPFEMQINIISNKDKT
jgi:chemotaxis protein CheX